MVQQGSPFNLTFDDASLAAAQRGEMIAHEALFNTFSSPVFNLAYRVCGSKEAAEDVLQNTFINVFNGIKTFRNHSPLGMWLRRIAINEALTWLRSNRRFFEMEDIAALETGSERAVNALETDREIDNYQVCATLEKMLAQLPAQIRLVLWLKEVEGYSHKEIAMTLGKSESYSKSLIARAFKRLRRPNSPHTDTGSDTKEFPDAREC